MNEFTEAKIVELAQSGNLDAVGELFDHYWVPIFNYVRAKVYDIQLAQDLTGEVFLRMVENLPRYRRMEGIPFSAWLFRIAHNLIISHRQKESVYQLVSIESANNDNHHHDNPEIIVEGQLERTQLLRSLERIDETQREVIILRFLVGLSLKEVASAMNKTVGSVKTLQRRGALALNAILKTA